jgi:hypothetical protein
MVHLAALDGMAERANDRLLPDHLGERARAVPAVQRLLLLLWLLLGGHLG